MGVTVGSDGFKWISCDGPILHCVAPCVDVVDTLGAGDVFHGAFALSIAEQQILQHIFMFSFLY